MNRKEITEIFSGIFTMHLINWDRICQPLLDGGLGIKNLRIMNKALLFELAWQMLRNPDTMLAEVLWSKYGRPLVEIQRGRSVSQIWRSIVYDGEVLKLGNVNRGITWVIY